MKRILLTIGLAGLWAAALAQVPLSGEADPIPDLAESEPLTLRRCLEIGLERNYDVRIVRNEEIGRAHV